MLSRLNITRFLGGQGLILWLLLGALFNTTLVQATEQPTEILPASAVFTPRIEQVSGDIIDIVIDIPPGYYIYRQRLFAVQSQTATVSVSDYALSPGTLKTDAYFGEQSVWVGEQTAKISVRYQNPEALANASLQLRYQGCQDGVICYPPQSVTLPVTLPSVTAFAQQPAPIIFAKRQSHTTGKASAVLSAQPKPLLAMQTQSKDLLSEDAAFALSVDTQDATLLSLHWRIADGYYLYRDKIRVSVSDKDSADNATDAPLGEVKLAVGTPHRDDFFGEQMIFRGQLVAAQVYLKRPVKRLALAVQFQGCADVGVCYPMMQRTVQIDNGFVSDISKTASAQNVIGDSAVTRLSNTLRSNLWAGIGLLLVAGIALAFTPCVLPMLPILLGIITHQRQVSKARAALLSSAYALGVAVMMAVFGLVVAKTGVNLQIIFQQPLWLMAFAAIFIVMGLAMLGVFSIAMPAVVQSRVIGWQNRFQHSSPVPVFIVGALSTLVVGPCIAPPLIAILAFIATTDDSFLGAVYLFSLGLGMSLPLIIFATLSTGIPKTGAFSRLITRLFAMLMFGVGLWLLARLLPGVLSLALWGVFFLIVGMLFWRSGLLTPAGQRLAQGAAAVAFAIGAAWLTGAAMGNSNPLKPFSTVEKLPFQHINNSRELQAALAHSDKPVMLDLYADWCVSCQEVEHITFTDPAVVDALSDFTLLKLDISATSAAHHQLLRELGLIGPPALLFFAQGKELKNERHIGAIKAVALLDKLSRLKK